MCCALVLFIAEPPSVRPAPAGPPHTLRGCAWSGLSVIARKTHSLPVTGLERTVA